MKKVCIALFSFLFIQNAWSQKNIAGAWEGKLSVSTTSLRLVFHIDEKAGAYTATMDSRDQGAKDIPVSSVSLKGDSLLMEVAVAGAKLSGKLTSDTSFTGRWIQGVSLPLNLKKLAAGQTIAELKRPQTPKPPFPYESSDVVYYNKDKSIQYGATITKPKGAGPFPSLLLLTGSGQQNRDEEIFGHKPFAVIADYLTRKGYLVMRVDDRGVGQTTGDLKNATTKDFANDALVGLDNLKSLPEADKTKLGLLGHSEGGMMAEIVAAQRNDLAFVVLLAAPGENVIDLMIDQNRALLQSAGMANNVVNAYLQLYKPLIKTLAFSYPESLETKFKNVVDTWLKQTPKELAIASTGITNDESKQKFVSGFLQSMNSPWFGYFLRYNPDVYIRKIKAKVLALNGDRDIQVLSKTNLPALKASLQKSTSKGFEVIELKGLNHFFQHCTKCTVTEYGELEETIAPEVLDTIGTWLDKNVK